MTIKANENTAYYSAEGTRLLANNYGPAPLTFTSAEGAWLVDVEGRRYLDFGSGISVTSFGHLNESIRVAAQTQMNRLWHTSNLYHTQPPLALAAKLVETSFAQRVFFCNSGAEANEAAIKLVRKAASIDRTPQRRTILTFRGGFHGRTLATITATAQEKYQRGFEPLPGGFRYAEFNNVKALEEAFDDTICAVMFETVQGEGGIHVAQPEFVQAVQSLAQQHGAWVVVDEVQTGLARTGKLWAYEWYDNFTPDVLTSAKALGGGLPIGAMLIGERLQDVLEPGSHGSTFGGNPVCCAAALAALRLATDPELQNQVNATGMALCQRLQMINDRLSVFSEIRGRGLMIGAQLDTPHVENVGAIVSRCRDNGLLLLQAGQGVLRFLPPLIISHDELDQAMQILEQSIKQVVQQKS